MAAIFFLLLISSVSIKRMASSQSACIFCHSQLAIRPIYTGISVSTITPKPFH